MHQDVFLAFIIALLIGSLTAYLAKGRGRSPITWFCIGALFGVLGLLALFLFPKNLEQTESKKAIIQEPEVHRTPAPPLAHAWYYLDESHAQIGPVSLSDLEMLYKSREVSMQTYLWCEGMQEWQKLEYIPTLEAYLAYRAESI